MEAEGGEERKGGSRADCGEPSVVMVGGGEEMGRREGVGWGGGQAEGEEVDPAGQVRKVDERRS